MRGRLITIEGLDGAGKTTLADALVDALRARGRRRACCCASPAGSTLSERIRALVKDPGLAVDPRAEALLYAAARAQLVAERVEPALAAGTWVLLDRFVDSSLAYQGVGRGLGVEAVRRDQPLRHRRPAPRPDAAAARRRGHARGAPGGPRRGARPARARGRRVLRRDRARVRRAGGGRARALPRARRGRRAGGRAGRGAGRARRPGLASVAVLGRRGAIALTCAVVLAHAGRGVRQRLRRHPPGVSDDRRRQRVRVHVGRARAGQDADAEEHQGHRAGLPRAARGGGRQAREGLHQGRGEGGEHDDGGRGRDDGHDRDGDDRHGHDRHAARRPSRPRRRRSRPMRRRRRRRPRRSRRRPRPLHPRLRPPTQSTASHKGARLALIVVGALLVMLLALWAFARWWAWEPHWLARWRHATAEAGWRASAAWAEFTDWLRLGR